MSLFEKTYIIDENKLPILIFDLRVTLWHLVYKLKHLEEFWTFDDYKKFWEQKFNLPTDVFPKQKYQLIVVDDTKYKAGNYWRDTYLQRLNKEFPKYKGNRDPNRPDLYTKLHKAALEYIEENNIPYFAHKGFEADDFAGAFCYEILSRNGVNRPVFLYTVDSDWGQLVNDDVEILFYYSGRPCWKHKLRSEDQILEWFEEKQNIKLGEVRKIVDFKVEHGDSSDNLIPGSPRGVIDLLDPAKKLPKKILKRVSDALDNPGFITNPLKAIKSRILTNKKEYGCINKTLSSETIKGS